MFTGIIESQAKLAAIHEGSEKRIFTMESALAGELRVDQSVAHDGVCLTVEQADQKTYQVTAITQTLALTSLRTWQIGQRINLERSLKVGARLDGHFVQGHVDATGHVLSIQEKPGQWLLTIGFPARFAHLLVAQGSIALNGISLTIAALKDQAFTVAIIPFTYENTNISRLELEQPVNLEFDILGKYMARLLESRLPA